MIKKETNKKLENLMKILMKNNKSNKKEKSKKLKST